MQILLVAIALGPHGGEVATPRLGGVGAWGELAVHLQAAAGRHQRIELAADLHLLELLAHSLDLLGDSEALASRFRVLLALRRGCLQAGHLLRIILELESPLCLTLRVESRLERPYRLGADGDAGLVLCLRRQTRHLR